MSSTGIPPSLMAQADNRSTGDQSLVRRDPGSGENQAKTTLAERAPQATGAIGRAPPARWLSWLRSLIIPRWVDQRFLIIARDFLRPLLFDTEEPHPHPTPTPVPAPAAPSTYSVRMGDRNKKSGGVDHSFNTETRGDIYHQKAYNMLGAGKGARFDKVVLGNGGAGSGSEN